METCWLYDRCNHIHCAASYCRRKAALDKLYAAAHLSEAQKAKVVIHIDEDETDKAEFTYLRDNVERDIVNFVKSGKNLYLHSSNCGNGKTTFAVRCIQTYLNAIWPGNENNCPALFVDVDKFLQALKNNITSPDAYAIDIKNKITTANLVVFDEVASKAGTEYERNQLLGIINDRILQGKSNIYTTNCTPAMLQDALGERLTSRICQLSIDVELHGADKRSLVAKGV